MGVSHVSMRKMTSGLRVVMMSQISVACLQSDCVLRTRQSSCSEAGTLSCLISMVELAARVGALVLEEKRQCRQVKGPTLDPGEAWQQLWRYLIIPIPSITGTSGNGNSGVGDH